MKSKDKRAVIKTARQRLAEWKGGHCPYCPSTNVNIADLNTKTRAVCFECGAENYFSGPSVRKLK